MELSKRALGFLSRQYKTVLVRNNLSNALTTCALSALLCVPVVLTSTNAMADITNPVIVDTNWISTGNVTLEDVVNDNTAGVKIAGISEGSLTVQAGHTISVSTSTTQIVDRIYIYGLYGECTAKSTLINNGTIKLTAEGKSLVNARGMMSFSENSTDDITNNGTIEVSAEATTNTGYATGMSGKGTLTNNGTIIANATGQNPNAKGMGVVNTNRRSMKLVNTGSITATANGSSAYAYGLSGGYSFTPVYITNEKEGVVKVSATSTGHSASACGIATSGGKGTVINDGVIEVSASHPTNSTMFQTSVGATGIKSNVTTNNGTLTVAAYSQSTYASAYGLTGEMSPSTKRLTNYGDINVTATAEGNHSARAVGMKGDAGTSHLNNYGTITVKATSETGEANAYHVYAAGNYHDPETAYIGTWKLELKEAYGDAVGYYIFGAGSDGTLHFGDSADTGANFIIANGVDDFDPEKCYSVNAMVHLDGGEVTGYIATAKSSYDFLQWDIVDIDGNAYDFTDPTYADQYLKGQFAPKADNSPVHAAAHQNVNSLNSNINQLRNIVAGQTRTVGEGLIAPTVNANVSGTATMYADANNVVSDAGGIIPEQKWSTFAMPYYSQTGANNGDYDAHMYGFAMGITRHMTDDFSLGLHAGIATGSGDSAYTDSDAMTYTLGAHAVYNVGESLFFRGQLSSFMAKSELDMIGSADALTRANTDMDTTGLYAMVAAGYDIPLNANHILTPELGLSYFYAHMDGFDADFYATTTGVKDASLGMASQSYDVWYADATLRWTGAFDMGTGTLKPTVKAGIRQAISDPDVASTMKFGTTSATTYSDANDTAFLCEAGLAWELDALTLSATYSGEFGNVEYSHMGMLKAEWRF